MPQFTKLLIHKSPPFQNSGCTTHGPLFRWMEQNEHKQKLTLITQSNQSSGGHRVDCYDEKQLVFLKLTKRWAQGWDHPPSTGSTHLTGLDWQVRCCEMVGLWHLWAANGTWKRGWEGVALAFQVIRALPIQIIKTPELILFFLLWHLPRVL